VVFNEWLIGKRERMSWIAETSYATGGTMTGGEVIGLNCKIDAGDWSKGFQEIISAGADDRLVQGRVEGPQTLPYTMSFTPVNWLWLKYIFADVDADDAGVKTHTFTMRNTILSYKLEWAKRATTSHVLTTIGNFVKTATMSFTKATGEGTEGFITVALGCMGQDVTPGSSVTTLSAGNITKTGFQYRMINWVLNSTEIPEVNNGEITFDAGINDNDSRYCNTTLNNLVGEPIPITFRINGRFNVNIRDSTMFDFWDAAVAVGGTNTLLVDRDGTGDDQLLITFGDFYILGSVASTNLEGVTSVDVVWSADSITSLVARDDIATY